MKKRIKKILSKKINIPDPQLLFSKKALLLILVFFALFYDLLILFSIQAKPLENNFKKENCEPTALEKNIRALVKNYPIEDMTPYISQKEKKTAAFLIGIAKKESNWGKYSPTLNGKNCYNYWGFRGQGENVTPSGYTCFKNPRQAVNIVANRLDELIENYKLDTPKKMIVWKCGWDCSRQNPESISKWIADVNYYYKKVYQ